MEPLASKIRPKTLREFVGQAHLVGKGKPIYEAVKKRHLFSFILWGPPGVGKTTLAKIYAKNLDAELHELSAVSAGKDDVKEILGTSQGKLGEKEMEKIISRTGFKIEKISKDWLIAMANGDARQALNLLEATDNLYGKITLDTLKDALQSKHLRYDKKGEEHYNTTSAFIKSMRASQPDAALYYLARMVEAGEDPKFIARRMVIFASEDIGLAQPTALVVANAVFEAVNKIGYQECSINLAHGVAYLAKAPKDRRAYDALRAAEIDVKEFGNLPIPIKIRNPVTKLMKDLKYGEDYEMYPGRADDTDNYLPEKLKKKKYLREN